jgi:transposase
VNVLADEKKQQVLALGQLGWPLRRIEYETGVRRETASGYLKAAGIAVRPPRTRRRPNPASQGGVSTDSDGGSTPNPASRVGVSTDSGAPGAAKLTAPGAAKVLAGPSRAPAASACEPYREQIVHALSLGRNAMAIYQDLVGAGARVGYASVRRFVRKLRGAQSPEERVVIETAPGEEEQVDYGEGPMVRHPETGKHRRTRLFVFTLGFSRKSVRLLVWKSSSRTWAELHEQAFRRVGGATKIVVLDNLREGVVEPDIYDPRLNPLYRDVLRHYGAVAMPCRVRDPDRKGKVESGVGHAKRTPLKGLRFESLEEAQAYLDQWEERWADTRIHGTTKRQVAAMFADERPHLTPLPVEPFRYYKFGDRTVHLDGCVEIDAAYYHAPPGWIGRVVHVQWDGLRVRLLCPVTGQLLREHLVQRRGGRRTQPGDEPAKTPRKILDLLAELARAGENVRTLTATFHQRRGEAAGRGLLGTRALVKKHGAVVGDDACGALLELGLADYRSLRRYLDRRPPAPLSLAQVDPLIRSLTHYRDLINQRTGDPT